MLNSGQENFAFEISNYDENDWFWVKMLGRGDDLWLNQQNILAGKSSTYEDHFWGSRPRRWGADWEGKGKQERRSGVIRFRSQLFWKQSWWGGLSKDVPWSLVLQFKEKETSVQTYQKKWQNFKVGITDSNSLRPIPKPSEKLILHKGGRAASWIQRGRIGSGDAQEWQSMIIPTLSFLRCVF